MSYSPLLVRLIDGLRCMPGVGQKSAQRIAFHLLERDRDGANSLSVALAASAVVMSLASIVIHQPLVWISAAVFWFAYLVSISGFLVFAARERGFAFAVSSLFVHTTLSLAVAIGVGSAVVLPERGRP